MQTCKGCGGAGCKACIDKKAPKLFLPIEPMGAVRTTKAAAGKTAAGQKYAAYKNALALLIQDKIDFIPSGYGIVLTDVTFFMPIPKSGTTTLSFGGKRRSIPVKEGMSHLRTPDLDNLLKGLKDGLNGHVWADDAPVYKYAGYVQKIYSEYPGIEFGIEVEEIF